MVSCSVVRGHKGGEGKDWGGGMASGSAFVGGFNWFYVLYTFFFLRKEVVVNSITYLHMAPGHQVWCMV